MGFQEHHLMPLEAHTLHDNGGYDSGSTAKSGKSNGGYGGSDGGYDSGSAKSVSLCGCFIITFYRLRHRMPIGVQLGSSQLL
eukprot:CAMPEP_0183704920 /NCGR_PEP_ID=MMETSP0737-20130205/2149_1 /TAXON_ID=385413 /ORGANISM="Thalassiosira miniscula, Strain CCMP1093" /LENGTH=81 /DNA_ID=CAMNT_0025931953 /DNA_START=377 /DNA_END=619 /DNA_ORIENTATION=-